MTSKEDFNTPEALATMASSLGKMSEALMSVLQAMGERVIRMDIKLNSLKEHIADIKNGHIALPNSVEQDLTELEMSVFKDMNEIHNHALNDYGNHGSPNARAIIDICEQYKLGNSVPKAREIIDDCLACEGEGTQYEWKDSESRMKVPCEANCDNGKAEVK